MNIIVAIKDRVSGKIPLFFRRSSKWDTIRKHWLKYNNECAACGVKDKLQVHHKKPFHIDPSLELDYNNLITLCENSKGREDHRAVGHLGNFKLENPNVERDAAKIRKSLGLPDLITRIPANK